MEQKKIIEGNHLIAEFMGMEPFENQFRGIFKEDGLYKRINSDGTIDIVGDLNYRTSWNWLMPVVGKIYEHYQKHPSYPTTPITTFTIFADIEMVWGGVVDFIKFYNHRNN
jgi:hypothetical protein